jgi:hypothetical protein
MKFLAKSRLNYRKAFAVGMTGNPRGGTLAGRKAFHPQGAAQLLTTHRKLALTPRRQRQLEDHLVSIGR